MITLLLLRDLGTISPAQFFIISRQHTIIRIQRKDWEDCSRAVPPCYDKCAAIIIDDHNFACGSKEEGNCFRPSYELTDLT